MKFARKLEEATFDSEWRYYYIQYKDLKRTLKKGLEKGLFTDEDEELFIKQLDSQISTIRAFRDLKGDELVRRTNAVTNIIRGIDSQLIDELSDNNDIHTDTTDLTSHSNADTDSNTSSRLSRAEVLRQQREMRLDEVDAMLTVILKEVRELSKFTTMNFTGCMKILKKHDKNTGRKLARIYQENFQKDPIHSDDYYSNMVLRLSNLFEDIRTLRTGAKVGDGPGIDAGNIVRKTTKYWVHPDNVLEIKLRILQHLPVLLFKKGEVDPAITSIYFDNTDFDLYHNRIFRDEGAQNLRFRWYGQWNKTDDVWVERKTHHESWVGIKSIKERFPIKEKDLNDYLAGRYDIEKLGEKIREKAIRNNKYSTPEEIEKVNKDVNSTSTLAREVQEMVLQKKLRPMIRTTYNRTAFQLPADARVRISLDTELAMIREDDFDKVRAGDNWRNVNVKNDFPFSYLEDKDIVRFPYAVLEIKLQTQHGQQVPQWAQELANSHLVEAVPKFSKFHHGVSTLLGDHVSMLPFWYYQMDTEIRRPPPPPIAPGSEPVGALHDQVAAMKYDKNGQLISAGPPSGNVGQLTYEQRQNLPVKIDQFGKIYFSNERTMLRWLNFGIQGLAISLALLNIAVTASGLMTATILVLLSLACMGYAVAIFHIRSGSLRDFQSQGFYDVTTTPIIVTIVLAVAIVAQVVWKASRDGIVGDF
ncbi:vacuolar transporter chaperone [Nowakowskiella sp. JEL0407]|nr:vacuolar transporter chaperone [Nowakowskiella sp. JEL0407]